MLQLFYAPSTYAVISLILLAGYSLYRAALPKPFPGIPYHKASARRILGDIPDLAKHRREHGTFHDWLSQQAVELDSPIYQLFLGPFAKPTVYVTDPRENEDVLLRRGKEFDRSKLYQDIFIGTVPNHHIVQPTNNKFRQGVRLIADTMGAPFLNGVAAPILHKHALSLMELWRVKSDAAAGRAFSAAEDLILVSFDSIWEMAFGSDLGALTDATAHLRAAATPELAAPGSDDDDPVTFPKPEPSTAVASMQIVALGINVTVPSVAPRFAHWRLRMTPAYRRAHAYNDVLVAERLQDAKERMLGSAASPDTHGGAGAEAEADMTGVTCATDLMVRREAQAARKEGRSPRYDGAAAKDELFGMLIGGFDTTATTLKWAVKLLADDARVQGKLRRALRDAFPADDNRDSTPPTAAQLVSARLPYLDAVVEELMRCSGTASGAVRTATRDAQLLGHRIPAGAEVFLMSNGPGYMTPGAVNGRIPEAARSPSSREHKARALPDWDPRDIGAFRPERWIKTVAGTQAGSGGADPGGEAFDARAGPSMQFGQGIRGCFGKKMVYLQFRIVIALLVWTFELLPVPDKLRGFEATESLARSPIKCYLRLKRVTEDQEH